MSREVRPSGRQRRGRGEGVGRVRVTHRRMCRRLRMGNFRSGGGCLSHVSIIGQINIGRLNEVCAGRERAAVGREGRERDGFGGSVAFTPRHVTAERRSWAVVPPLSLSLLILLLFHLVSLLLSLLFLALSMSLSLLDVEGHVHVTKRGYTRASCQSHHRHRK